MLDLVALAGSAITTILVPYIRDGAAKFAATIAEKEGQSMGEYAAGMAGKVWDKVKSAFGSDSEKVVLEQFEKKPEKAGPLVEATLQEKLEQNPQLAKEIDELMNTLSPDGKSTGAQIIGSSYVGFIDMRNAHVSGDHATFTGGTFNIGAETMESRIRNQRPDSVPDPRKPGPAE